MSTLSAKEYKCFEDIKRVRPDGSEYHGGTGPA